MNSKQLISTIEAELEKSGFYDFLKNQPKIQQKLLTEFDKARTPKNPRNLQFSHSWEEIDSYGPDRRLLLMELGGTYFKIFLIKIKNNKVTIWKKYRIKFYKNIVYTPKILFQEIQRHLDKFTSNLDRSRIKNTIFIFTFPLNQFRRPDGMIDGICGNFGKTRKSKGIVGIKVGEKLQKHLNQNGYPNIKLSVTNDSPPSLLSAKKIEIEDPKTHFHGLINLIVGTGTNIAVGYNLNNKFFLSNTEFGTFDAFPQSEYDKRMDAKLTEGRGTYKTEKMFSGIWRPKVFQEIVKDLFRKKILLKSDYKQLKLESLDACTLDDLLCKKVKKTDPLYPLAFIWDQIAYRGGYICGFSIAKMILKLKSRLRNVDFGIIEVGAVLEHSQTFRFTMIDTINSLLEQNLSKQTKHHRIVYNLLSFKDQTVYGATIFDAFIH